MIPINLAFFYRDSAADKMMAMYPSPAGADRIVVEPRILDTDSRRAPGFANDRTGCRDAFGESRERARGVLHRSHRRMFPLGWIDPHALAGAFRWNGGLERDSPVLRGIEVPQYRC